MSRLSSATVNYTLTAYAQGCANDISGARAIVNALCPTVQVVGATGQYKIFNDQNSFQSYKTSRAIGGGAKRIEFGATDGTFNCKPQALEITIDDHEKEVAAGSSLSTELLQQGKIKALVTSTMLSHTKDIIDYVAAETTAEAGKGVWSNATIDPIDQLDEQIQALTTAMGSKENIKLVIGMSAYSTLRSHAKVKARASGVKLTGITADDIRGMLIFPIEIIVGVLSYNTAALGQTVSKSQMLGDIAYIVASQPSPSVYDPSPFKCFTTGINNIESVRQYRDESARSDVYAMDWSRDIVETSTISLKRLAIT